MPIISSMVDSFLMALKRIEERLGVLREFRLVAFIVMLVIGGLIIYYSYDNSRIHVLDHLADSTAVVTRTVIDPNLKSKDFDWPAAKNSKSNFDNTIKMKVIKLGNTPYNQAQHNNKVIVAKVWNSSGRVVYDSSGKTTGEIHADNDELEKAMKGEIEAGYTRADSEDRFTSQGYDELIEIYIPARINGKIVGAYELYLTTDSIVHFTRQTLITISFITFLGLLLLFLSLSWLFSRAHNRISEKNEEAHKLTEKVVSSLKELEENYLGTIQALTMAVDAKDHYTAGHSFRVASLTKEIGNEMGVSKEALKNLERGARFHDIGKIGIKEGILNKHGTLTKKEFKIMEQHTTIGAKILGSVKFLRDIVPIVRSHHERLNGSGYPDGLMDQQISLGARIVAVADVFEAMTSDRPNRKALSVETAFRELRQGSDTLYDQEVVAALLRAFRGSTFIRSGDEGDEGQSSSLITSDVDEEFEATFLNPEKEEIWPDSVLVQNERRSVLKLEDKVEASPKSKAKIVRNGQESLPETNGKSNGGKAKQGSPPNASKNYKNNKDTKVSGSKDKGKRPA